jgi:helicase
LTDLGRDAYQALQKTRETSLNLPHAVANYLKLRRPQIIKLFPIQQTFLNRGLLLSPDNVCAFGYPGSGKTLLSEMCMANEVGNRGKSLYCTPYKALDWQKYQDFKDWFGAGLGASVVIADGDNPVTRQRLEEADIVVATYERVFEGLRRKEPWLRKISFFCADELTLLADESRGSTLDFLLTWIKSTSGSLRMVTLSTTVGNMFEISDWLNAIPVIENRPPPGVEISESIIYPSKKGVVIRGIDGEKKAVDGEQDPIDYIVRQNLERGETTLIFVGTRPDAEKIARKLKTLHSFNRSLSQMSKKFFAEHLPETTRLTDALMELLPYGVAFHHAGLQRAARKFVERLMNENKIQTVVATRTLSHGVDFHIDSVLIDHQGLDRVRKVEGYEYVNLKGRVGRPGKSKAASVWILTQKNAEKQSFNRFFLTGPGPVRSSSVLSKERLAAFLMSTTQDGSINPEKLLVSLSNTLGAKTGRWRELLDVVLNDLVALGFVARSVEYGCKLTKLGERVNLANLSPYDATNVLALQAGATVEMILDVASSIDLAKLVRRDRATLKIDSLAVDVLLDWIKGTELRKITESPLVNLQYQDQDILTLAEYTSLALGKMSVLIENSRLKEKFLQLELCVRHGIPEERAQSDILQIDVIEGRNLKLARNLFRMGYFAKYDLKSLNPLKLAVKLGIEETLANKIILSAASSQLPPAEVDGTSATK